MAVYDLHVDKDMCSVDVDRSKPLLCVLGESLNLTQTRFDCGYGLCDACTCASTNPATKTDYTWIDGLTDIHYAIDHQELFHRQVDLGIPISSRHLVGKCQNSFFVESFVDEIVDHPRIDPWQLRRNLLSQDARAKHVLNKCDEVCHWVDHQSMGRAYSRGFGALAAMAAPISFTNNKIKVENLWTVEDCGHVVNPESAKSQIQRAAIYDLAAALHGKMPNRVPTHDEALSAPSIQ